MYIVIKSNNESIRLVYKSSKIKNSIVDAILDKADLLMQSLFIYIEIKDGVLIEIISEITGEEILSESSKYSDLITSKINEFLNEWIEDELKTNVYTLQLDNGQWTGGLYYEFSEVRSSVFSVLKWVTFQRLSFSTLKRQLYVLNTFYNYCATRRIDLERLLETGSFNDVAKNFQDFSCYTSVQEINGKQISAESLNQKIMTLKNYLFWVLNHCNSSNVDSYAFEIIKESVAMLQAKEQSSFYTYKSINKHNLIALKKYYQSSSKDNPFSPALQLRNFLIIEIMLMTGCRKSELLKLKTTDIIENEESYYLNFQDNTIDKNDNRPELGFKTYGRIIEIPKELWESINLYIDSSRRINHSVPMTHLYLFTSKINKPISVSSIDKTFSTLKSASSLLQLSAHSLRHTFVNDKLAYLIEKEKLDMEQALDILRYLCGWSNSSRMPERYARQYVSKLGNSYNQKRINSSWEG